MKITKAKQGAQQKASFLLYGASGSGKTTTAAMFPAPIVALLEPNGRCSVETVSGEIDVCEITATKDLVELIRHLRSGEHKYQTVVLDSGTELDRVIEREITGGDRPLQIQEYRDLAKESRRYLESLRELPLIFVALYLEKMEQDDHGKVFRRPSATGRAWSDEIPSMFNYVFRACRTTTNDSEGKPEVSYALEQKSSEESVLKQCPRIKSAMLPQDPKRWIAKALPERFGTEHKSE